MNPVHHAADNYMDCFKNRLEQILERFQQRRDKVVNGLPYSCDNRPDCIQHRADRCMNGIPYDCDNSFDEIDFLCNTVINRRPDADKKVLDSCPYRSEKVLDSVED